MSRRVFRKRESIVNVKANVVKKEGEKFWVRGGNNKENTPKKPQ